MQLNILPVTRSVIHNLQKTRGLDSTACYNFVSIFKNYTFDPAGKEYSHKHFTGEYRGKEQGEEGDTK